MANKQKIIIIIMAIISLVVGFFIGQQCKSIPDTVESQIFRKLGIDVEKI